MTETTDRVFDRLSAQLPADRAYSLDDLSAADVPEGISHFLAQTLQRRLELEAAALAKSRSRWFDYGAPELQEAQASYLVVLAEHAHIPAEEWHHTLRQAVIQVVPYLVQPARALVRFVFPPGRDELSAEVVRRRMRYFSAYGYLTEVVRAYLSQKGEEVVTRSGLSRLLQRIEHRTPAEYDAGDWVGLLEQLYEVAGEGRPLRVEVELLSQFLRDKGMQEQAQAVEAHRQPVTADTLRDLLSQSDALRKVAPLTQPNPSAGLQSAPAPTPPHPTPALEQDQSVEFVQPKAEPPAPIPESIAPIPEPAPTAPQPLWQRFAQGRTGSVEPSSADAPQPLWKQFGKSSAVPPSATQFGSAPDLDRSEHRALGSVPAAQRRLYIRDLFSGSETAYGDLLGRLAIAGSWSEASRVLGAAYRDHQVNIYSATAVSFTEAAERRFHS